MVSADGLVAVDTSSRQFDGPWGVPGLGQRVATLARSPAQCALITGGEEQEVWSYELPSLRLRSRMEVPPVFRGRVAGLRQLAAAADGTVAEQWVSAAVLHLKMHGAPPLQIPLPGEEWLPGELAVSAEWMVGAATGPGASRVFLVHRKHRPVKAEVLLWSAQRVTLHLPPQTLTLADDRGRVVVLDLEYGQIRRDIRI